MPSILQDSKIVNIAAARSPPASEPRKTKFLRVIARGLIARSAALLVISNRPSVVYRVSADHREVAYRMALASVPAPLDGARAFVHDAVESGRARTRLCLADRQASLRHLTIDSRLDFEQRGDPL